MTFRRLGLDRWLEEVCSSLGMKIPTPVQEACIPPILRGQDCIGSAETGSGKTAAFVLPILHALGRDPVASYALILEPARELAFQIAEQVRALGAPMGVREVVVVGGLDPVAQLTALSKKPHVIIATPGRLVEILQSTGSDRVLDLRRVRVVVLDEADRLLDPAFEEELDLLFASLNSRRQTLLFSATITPSLEKIQRMNLDRVFRFSATARSLETVENLQQTYLFIPDRVKDCYLSYLLRKKYSEISTIVFVGRCDTCELVARTLTSLGIQSVALHSQIKQDARLGILNSFRNSVNRVMIATDVASRGLDIPWVGLVINYNIPSAPDTYVHRVGRTARAGRCGRAINLITQYDVDLVRVIEDKIDRKLELESGIIEREVLQSISEVFKARRVARLEMVDSGFMDRVDKRRKRKREIQRSTGH